jgi:hypothetical protein
MESSNTFKFAVTVASLAQLADVHVARWDDGTPAWVIDQATVYFLRKASAAVANGFSIIAPNAGSPIAGAAGARWLRQLPGGGVVLQTLYAELPADVSATNGAPLVLPSITFTPTQAGLRAYIDASWSGNYDRGGVAAFAVLLDTVVVKGSQQTGAIDAGAAEEAGAIMCKTGGLTVASHTINFRLTPAAALVVAVNAASEPTTDHATLRVMLVTD